MSPPLLRTAARIFSGTAEIFRNKLFKRFGREVSMSLEGFIKISHIGIVVFAMMNFHGLSIDMRLERIKRISSMVMNVS